MKGIFITFEGIEGCGKTTQIDLLRRHLEAAGREVVVTREPGGTAIAESIRALLLDPTHTAMAPIAELLLYEAARAQHVAELIQPALERGAVVLCDRFFDSTTAYQGAGRGLGPEVVHHLHQVATGGLLPDLTVLFDLPAEEGMRRVHGRGAADRIERESIAFHHAVRQGFLAIAAAEPHRIRIVDATQDVATIAAQVQRETERLLAVHQ